MSPHYPWGREATHSFSWSECDEGKKNNCQSWDINPNTPACSIIGGGESRRKRTTTSYFLQNIAAKKFSLKVIQYLLKRDVINITKNNAITYSFGMQIVWWWSQSFLWHLSVQYHAKHCWQRLDAILSQYEQFPDFPASISFCPHSYQRCTKELHTWIHYVRVSDW
jgi:hypothetical protein